MLPDLRRTYCCEQFVPIFAELHDAKRWKNRKTRKAGRKRAESGPIDASIAACENFKVCGAQWETDDFVVKKGAFIDYKYNG